MSLSSGPTPATGHLTALEQTATSWRSDNEASARTGTSMARKVAKGSPRSRQTRRRIMQEIALFATAALVLQCCMGGGNVAFAEGRLLQKANTFKDKFVKAFKGSYCINLASGTVHVGTNTRYDCHNREENFSYTEAVDTKKAATCVSRLALMPTQSTTCTWQLAMQIA